MKLDLTFNIYLEKNDIEEYTEIFAFSDYAQQYKTSKALYEYIFNTIMEHGYENLEIYPNEKITVKGNILNEDAVQKITNNVIEIWNTN